MLVELEKIEKAKEKIGAARTAEIAADLLQLEKFDARNLKACCPFHDEATPSFVLNQKTMKFHCFGCGKNADLLDVYMHCGMTYMGAVQALFEEAGMECSFGELGVKTRSEYRYPHADDCGTRDAVNAYMQQRGISFVEARQLLMRAVVGEVIDGVSLEALRDRLHHLVEKRFRGELGKCGDCNVCK